jgi:putative transposase
LRQQSPRHERRSIRLKEDDYSQPGAYFVTMVTHHRKCIFGEVVNGVMRLNNFGIIAKTEWFRTSLLRANVQMHPNEFIVMPNHIHGIIWIVETDYKQSKGAATLRPYYESNNIHKINVFPHSLGAIIRAYKSAVTYHINSLRESPGKPIWQRNYYEHIIRHQADLKNCCNYIQTNPVTWTNDSEYISPNQNH